MTDRITETIQLVRQSQDGDAAALDTLFGRYYPRVLKVVRLRMGPKLRVRLESGDILQDAFAAAIRRFRSFEMRNEASFINWLSKIAESAIHDAADKVSAKKRDPDREMALDATTDGETFSLGTVFETDFAIPVDQAVRNEERDLLDACIESLAPQYRECILLRNYVGLSFREIAEQTDRPSEAAARMMHAKAMAELVDLVRRRGGGPTGPDRGTSPG